MGTYYNVKGKVLNFISDIRVYPLGLVLYGQTGYKIKGDDTRKILDLIEPGDVLLTRYDHYITYILNALGFYGHAGIYVGDDKVVHMLGDGVQNEDILTFTRKDHILILRHKDPEEAKKAVSRALVKYIEGVEYDFDFSEFNQTLYCSELIYEVFDKPKEMTKSLGKYVMPDDCICDIFTEVLKVPEIKKG